MSRRQVAVSTPDICSKHCVGNQFTSSLILCRLKFIWTVPLPLGKSDADAAFTVFPHQVERCLVSHSFKVNGMDDVKQKAMNKENKNSTYTIVHYKRNHMP